MRIERLVARHLLQSYIHPDGWEPLLQLFARPREASQDRGESHAAEQNGLIRSPNPFVRDDEANGSSPEAELAGVGPFDALTASFISDEEAVVRHRDESIADQRRFVRQRGTFVRHRGIGTACREALSGVREADVDGLGLSVNNEEAVIADDGL